VSTVLAPLRHRQGDFFVADILDASPQDDAASMDSQCVGCLSIFTEADTAV
jgi:hypothetical protein